MTVFKENKMFKYSFLILLINSVCSETNTSYVPVVLWHGMGDSCCFPFSLGHIQQQIESALPGIYVLSLEIGSTVINDVENSYFLHPNKQIEIACEKITNDVNLKDGFNAIGFSQGSQFLRGLVQRCPSAKVQNLISLGGQHQGVYGLPNCGALSHAMCDYVRKLLNHAAYFKWVQDTLTQATFWHDPLNETIYKKYSTFLSDINNELTINQDYVKRLQNLKNFVLVKFETDSMVEPVESEWFGFYKPGQSKQIQTLQESALYIEDRLGLKQMDVNGKLHFLSTPGNHLRFTWDWFVQNILDPYLKN